ncbi:guanylate kinase [Rhodovibrio sodomensis]|uniref:Guanylate kinase n=1 Tax=Rhodovibrio sodomensis TaxID=1088 RepID=A0ABS1DCQ2_9PROT|nr:guanylate kinase [Rhodovibrio sodomensis]MBK1668248.1 guanylate kinase [Rhodovibrio sodomensis]
MVQDGLIKRRGLMLVLSSPSGAGKTTISRRLLADQDNLQLSISCTTRQQRPSEEEGIDYHFVDEATFRQMVDDGEFLEYAKVFGNYYGTPRRPVEAALARGEDVLFDIDWQGTQQVKETAGEDLVSVFILPPTKDALEHRLRTRAQDPEHVVRQRMAKASDEMSHYTEYDYIVVNEQVEKSVSRVTSILQAERLRRSRQTGLHAFVAQLVEDTAKG